MSEATIDQILIWYRELEQGFCEGSHNSQRTQRRGAVTNSTELCGSSVRFPKVVVRDQKGRELDTESIYQSAIYEAKWKLSQGEVPKLPEEWRLPHAPVPSRPDYSRQPPPASLYQLKRNTKRKKTRQRNHSRAYTYPYPESLAVTEFETTTFPGSVSFQSINTLPGISSGIDDTSSQTGGKTYMSIVDSVKFCEKELSETDRRQPQFVPPQYAQPQYVPPQYVPLSARHGCTRTELCYGCDRESDWHYHHDKPMRTGGGYTYWKRDFPSSNIKFRSKMSRENKDHLKETNDPTENIFYHGAEYPDLEKYTVAVKVSKVLEGHKKIPPEIEEPVLSNAALSELPAIRIKHKENLYKAPKPFQIKPTEKKATAALDPFSKNRTYDIPAGDGFQISKSDKEVTQFLDMEPIEVDYKPPKPFELKQRQDPPAVPPPTADIPSELPVEQISETPPIIAEYPIVIPLSTTPSEGDGNAQYFPSITPELFENEDQLIVQVADILSPEKSPEPPYSPDSGVESIPAPLDRVVSARSLPSPIESSVVSDSTPVNNQSASPAPSDSAVATPAPSEDQLSEHASSYTPQTQHPSSSPPPQELPAPEGISKLSPEPQSQAEEPLPEHISPEPIQSATPSPPEEEVITPKEIRTPSPKPVEAVPEIKYVTVEQPAKPTKIKPPPLPPRKTREAGRKPQPPKDPTPPPPVLKPPTPKPATPPKSPTPSPEPSPTPSMPTPTPEPELEEEYSFIRVEDTPVEVDLSDLLPAPKAVEPRLKRFVFKKVLQKKPRAQLSKQPVQPITWKELREINDPLDYLAKYCIIHPERLPFYDRIFNNTIAKQKDPYEHVPASWEEYKNKQEDAGEDSGIDNRTPTPDPNVIMFRDMSLVSKAQDFDPQFGFARGVCDVLVDKCDWTVDGMKERYEELEQRINYLEVERKRFILNAISKHYPQLLKYDYDADAKSKKKKVPTATLR